MRLQDGLCDRFVTESMAQLLAGLRDPSCRTLTVLPPEEAAAAFAAALANEKKAELVTGDPEFKPLEKEVKINWLGRTS